ncbi:MAG: hypothetical protein ACKPHU_36735, partial [Planctomycetaceae bacterium]
VCCQLTLNIANPNWGISGQHDHRDSQRHTASLSIACDGERQKSRGCGEKPYHQETRDPQLPCISLLFDSSPESVGKECGLKAPLRFSKRGSGRSLEVQKTGLP